MFKPPRQFVSDDDVSAALEYLDLDPHPESDARWRVTKAENELEETWAIIYGQQKEGSIKDREAAADRSERVVTARDAIADAQKGLDRHKARIRWATTILDIWRTQSSNTRSAHSVR